MAGDAGWLHDLTGLSLEHARRRSIDTPVVLVPGVSQNARAWDLVHRHLARAGFSHVAFVGGGSDIPRLADRIAHHVEAVRSLTGAERVHLAGHNIGGIAARYYVQLLSGDRLVDTVVTVGSPHGGTRCTPVALGPAAAQLRPGSALLRHLEESARPSAVRWIAYFSDVDRLVQPAQAGMLRHPMLRATNVLVPGEPHLSLLLPPGVCRSLSQQLAAVEHVPGYGAPLSPLPLVTHLAPDADERVRARPSAEAVARAKARHPSMWRRRRSRAEPFA